MFEGGGGSGKTKRTLGSSGNKLRTSKGKLPTSAIETRESSTNTNEKEQLKGGSLTVKLSRGGSRENLPRGGVSDGSISVTHKNRRSKSKSPIGSEIPSNSPPSSPCHPHTTHTHTSTSSTTLSTNTRSKITLGVMVDQVVTQHEVCVAALTQVERWIRAEGVKKKHVRCVLESVILIQGHLDESKGSLIHNDCTLNF